MIEYQHIVGKYMWMRLKENEMMKNDTKTSKTYQAMLFYHIVADQTQQHWALAQYYMMAVGKGGDCCGV